MQREPHKKELEKILEITEIQELKKIISFFDILDEPVGHLMCIGTTLFDFVVSDNEKYQIEYLGSGYIRIEKHFKSDVKLKNPLDLLHWLDERGISEPLESWKEEEKRVKEQERRILEWKAAAPKILQKLMGVLNQDPFDQIDEDLYHALRKEIPDETQLILALFNLLGTGFYEWSGYPIYEDLPSQILIDIEIEALNKAFEIEHLQKEQKEGMARFLASWGFNQKRGEDINRVKESVKNALLTYLEEMGDEGKIQQFKKRVIR